VAPSSLTGEGSKPPLLAGERGSGPFPLSAVCLVLGVAYSPHAQFDRGGRGSSTRAPLVARATRVAGIGVLYIDIYIHLPTDRPYLRTYVPTRCTVDSCIPSDTYARSCVPTEVST